MLTAPLGNGAEQRRFFPRKAVFQMALTIGPWSVGAPLQELTIQRTVDARRRPAFHRNVCWWDGWWDGRFPRKVAVEPLLSSLKASPSRYGCPQRHFCPLRMERRLLQSGNLWEKRIHQQGKAAIAVVVRRPIVGRQNRFGRDRIDHFGVGNQVGIVRRRKPGR